MIKAGNVQSFRASVVFECVAEPQGVTAMKETKISDLNENHHI